MLNFWVNKIHVSNLKRRMSLAFYRDETTLNIACRRSIRYVAKSQGESIKADTQGIVVTCNSDDFPSVLDPQLDSTVIIEKVFRTARHYNFVQIYDKGSPVVRVEFATSTNHVGLTVEIRDVYDCIFKLEQNRLDEIHNEARRNDNNTFDCASFASLLIIVSVGLTMSYYLA